MAAYKQNKMRIILLARLCSDFPHHVRRGAIIQYNSPTLSNEPVLATFLKYSTDICVTILIK